MFSASISNEALQRTMKLMKLDYNLRHTVDVQIFVVTIFCGINFRG